MDIATIIGVIAGIAALVISISLSGTLIAFFDIPSIFIVFGGTVAATLINFPLADIVSVIGVVKHAFLYRIQVPTEAINQLVGYSEIARREGILALESEADTLNDAFMKKGIQLAVDGTAPDLIRNILETELAYVEERHKLGQGILEAMGALAPAFGMIGTLIGLINMLKSLEDPSQIGVGMSVALVTTFYGAVMANLFFIPLAGKLKNRGEQESLLKELMIDGIMSIHSGDNPRVVQEKLKSFLSPKMRSAVRRQL
ncbi:MAG: motility protein A [Candidatus Omnitrophica bacterium]|nr:motility protein A [Candidatus Omnitrophota bacterium]